MKVVNFSIFRKTASPKLNEWTLMYLHSPGDWHEPWMQPSLQIAIESKTEIKRCFIKRHIYTYVHCNVRLANCVHLRICIQKPDSDSIHAYIQVAVNRSHISHLPIQCHKHKFAVQYIDHDHNQFGSHSNQSHRLVCCIKTQRLPSLVDK